MSVGADDWWDAPLMPYGAACDPTPSAGLGMGALEADNLASWRTRSAWWKFVAPRTEQAAVLVDDQDANGWNAFATVWGFDGSQPFYLDDTNLYSTPTVVAGQTYYVCMTATDTAPDITYRFRVGKYVETWEDFHEGVGTYTLTPNDDDQTVDVVWDYHPVTGDMDHTGYVDRDPLTLLGAIAAEGEKTRPWEHAMRYPFSYIGGAHGAHPGSGVFVSGIELPDLGRYDYLSWGGGGAWGARADGVRAAWTTMLSWPDLAVDMESETELATLLGGELYLEYSQRGAGELATSSRCAISITPGNYGPTGPWSYLAEDVPFGDGELLAYLPAALGNDTESRIPVGPFDLTGRMDPDTGGFLMSAKAEARGTLSTDEEDEEAAWYIWTFSLTYTVQAPRVRFLLTDVELEGYLPPVAVNLTPPRRVHPRDDGLAGSSAPRLAPGRRAVQGSNRVAGGYL